MRNFIFLLLIGLASLPMQAQDLIMVYSVEGKVRYLADDKPETKAKKVIPGMKLSEGGTIIIKEDGKVGIYFDELMGTLAKNGRHPVSSILDAEDLLEETDLAAIFGERLEKAAHPYYATIKTNRAGYVSSTTTTQTVSKPGSSKPPKEGHGDKKFRITPISPAGGKVSGDTMFFRWKLQDSVKVSSKLVVNIRDASKEVIAQVPAKKLARQVPVQRLKLKEGNNYDWFVNDTSDDQVRSAPVSFQYVSSQEVLKINEQLNNTLAYTSSSPSAQMLMKATMLEQKGYLMDAVLLLRNVTKADKKNKLAKRLLNSFYLDYYIIE